MSYVPPHKRNEEWTTIEKKPSKKAEKPKKKEYVEEFPSLNNQNVPVIVTVVPDKPTLATLFANSLKRRQKKKQPYIKKGWILLTRNGMIDSLTPEERKLEDEEHEHKINQIRMNRMILQMDARDNYRREYDHTYLWEFERLEQENAKYEQNEEESDYESETELDSYEEDYLEEDTYYEL